MISSLLHYTWFWHFAVFMVERLIAGTLAFHHIPAPWWNRLPMLLNYIATICCLSVISSWEWIEQFLDPSNSPSGLLWLFISSRNPTKCVFLWHRDSVATDPCSLGDPFRHLLGRTYAVDRCLHFSRSPFLLRFRVALYTYTSFICREESTPQLMSRSPTSDAIRSPNTFHNQ